MPTPSRTERCLPGNSSIAQTSKGAPQRGQALRFGACARYDFSKPSSSRATAASDPSQERVGTPSVTRLDSSASKSNIVADMPPCDAGA
eukprot:4973287-Alexandrium_andersonii.AAC.1